MNRINSIDIVRGIAMVVMALDHVRDWTHAQSIAWGNPTNLATTTPFLFFTRWITHFCAPTFIFLAGTSIYLSMIKRGPSRQQSMFLLSRGLWLVLLEIVVISLGWHLNPTFPFVALQVIWAIGVSMIVLSLTSRWGITANAIIGGIIVLGHNTLDGIQRNGMSATDLTWQALHQFMFHDIGGGRHLYLVYPVLPWIGLMMLGFAFGKFIHGETANGQNSEAVKRRNSKTVLLMGVLITAIFIVLRFTNLYGDPHQWSIQRDAVFTVMSFLNCEKYPPSLLYLCMTIGPMLVLLGFLMKLEIRLDWVRVFGRVPMFYYIIHLYVGHILAWSICLLQGYSLGAFWDNRTFGGNPAGSGYDLWVSYAVWITLVVLLYPVCKWYDKYKTANPQKTLLRYI